MEVYNVQKEIVTTLCVSSLANPDLKSAGRELGLAWARKNGVASHQLVTVSCAKALFSSVVAV